MPGLSASMPINFRNISAKNENSAIIYSATPYNVWSGLSYNAITMNEELQK